MMDRETSSLWSHITGKCLDGELAGSRLDQLPSVQTSWKLWQSAHPETRVLKKSEEITSSKYQKYFDNPEMIGILPMTWQQDRLPGKTLIHGLLVNDSALAILDDSVNSDSPLEVDLNGLTVAVHRDKDGGVRAVRPDTGEKLLIRLAYWFAWSAYFPETGIYPAPAFQED